MYLITYYKLYYSHKSDITEFSGVLVLMCECGLGCKMHSTVVWVNSLFVCLFTGKVVLVFTGIVL